MKKRLGLVVGVIVTLLFIFTNKATALTMDGLVSWWKFDGDITDSQGNNDGTVITNGTFVAGHNGQAVSFNGDGYVKVPDSDTLDITDAITFEAYVYRTADATQDVLSKTGNIYRMAFISGFPARPRGIINEGSPKLLNPWSTVPLNTWTHVAFTYDKDAGENNYLGYVNGTLESATATYTNPITTNANDLYIGSYYYNAYHFTGLIDDVRIYNRALTPAEIEDNYKYDDAVIPTP